MDNEEGESSKIRVKMPNNKVNEMFAIAEQILGGRRVTVLCADGETRMARIPVEMRRRQWVREGDLIIVWPCGFPRLQSRCKASIHQNSGNVSFKKRSTSIEVDVFGMNTQVDDFDDEDGLFASSNEDEEAVEEEVEEMEEDDDDDEINDLFG